MLTLHSYWRSSAAYRVRIVLNLKGVTYRYQSVNLLETQHKASEYLDLNPAGLVPTLELEDGRSMGQSLAIIQWLEEQYPNPALLPSDSWQRAEVLAMAYTVACEIHPLNNVGVLNYLRAEYGTEEPQINEWMYHWLKRGFSTLDKLVTDGPYCCGEQLTLADVLLVPMIYNARRFSYDMSAHHPRLHEIWTACNELDAFQRALPEQQPDAC